MARPKKTKTDREPHYHTGVWSSTYVQCPFYAGETRQSVACEGLEPGERIRRVLPGESVKREMMLQLCKNINGFDQCPIYRLVASKYDK